MSNSVPMGSYATSNVDMNGLLVASCRPDQTGAYPPIYNVPHGTIQLAQGFNSMPGSTAWPFPMAPVAGQQGANNQMPNIQGSFPQFGSPISTHAPAPVGTPQTPKQPVRNSSGPVTGNPPPSEAPVPETSRAGKAPATDEASGENAGGDGADARANARKRTLAKGEKDSKTGRRKIKIEFIDDDSRRHITFSKRKAGIMKKAYELATLTGTQVLLLVVSQTGLVYTFTTPKLEAIVKQPEGRSLIQECLSAPGPDAAGGPSSKPGEMYPKEEGDDFEEGEEEDEEEDEVPELGSADAGLTAQTYVTSPVSEAPPFLPNSAAPLFHPGWAAPSLGKRNDYTKSQIKRRRTQPNLSTSGMAGPQGHPSMNDMNHAYYQQSNVPPMPADRSMSESHMMPNQLPLYYGQPLSNEERSTPHFSGQTHVPHELHIPSTHETAQQTGSNSSA
ncbi:transcription factor of the MADS box [Malassezia japonica]|uniref:Transcription factor of the MADS box n=1 Tax=Malassezia japonica TaxID=223818 RepID=A0AAF0JBD8_9BASI|nr:transcription factor of the MADS box [Malassezia japonica]WFD39824.1 transcription factor of the MADS box [Malassezia japonica]